MTACARYRVPKCREDAGFTVLELLVALVLLALVMTMVPRTLELATRAFRAADVIDARSAEAASIDFLAARLAEAMPVYRRSNDGLLAIAFRGEEHEISFVAPLSAGKDATGLAVFTLKAGAEANAARSAAPLPVTLTWQIFRADTNPNQPAPPVHTRDLLPSNEGFAFRYRGPIPAREQGERIAEEGAGPALGDWQSQWATRDVLPSEVEITYKSVSGKLHTRTVDLQLVTTR